MKRSEFRIKETPGGFYLERRVSDRRSTGKKIGPWWNRKPEYENFIFWKTVDEHGLDLKRYSVGRLGVIATRIPAKAYKTKEEVVQIIEHLCAKQYPVYYDANGVETEKGYLPEFPADRTEDFN